MFTSRLDFPTSSATLSGSPGETVMPSEPDPLSDLGDYKSVFKFYEDGKGRRYALLFAVNGGVLAIAAALSPTGKNLVAGLSTQMMAYGMAVFTVIFSIDIWWFGNSMRKAAGHSGKPLTEGLFNVRGRLVLAAICVLIAGGWLSIAGAFKATAAA
jgi:hypothetical protein